MTADPVRQLYEAFAAADRILVASEVTADADAVGAELSLAHVARHAQRSAGRAESVTIVNQYGCPKRYAFLPGTEAILALDELGERDRETPFDLGVTVDGGLERVGTVAPLVRKSARVAIIDHHKFGSNEEYDVSLYDPRASSTTQLIYQFFEEDGLAVPLTRDVATAIYAGLIFDTGSFQYSLTQPQTHRIAARLLETGIDFVELHERILLVRPLEELVAAGRAIAAARRSDDGLFVWAVLDPETLRACGGDGSSVMQPLCFTEGIALAFVLI
ncbi:MAG: DHH family phosphoesterase, partial [Planctomycetota bacterium]